MVVAPAVVVVGIVKTVEFETLYARSFENHFAAKVPMSILFQSGFAKVTVFVATP